MKKQLLTLLLLVCSLGMNAGSALIPDMKFRRLDTRDGLSNSQINYIFQDSRGFVWIATSYGLNRYDGYRFRTFYSDASDSTTLRNNYVDYIWEDQDGKLWLRQGMNYCVFDPKTEQTVRNPSTILSKIGIKGGIDRIYIDSKKNLYVKTYDEGLYYYNPKTKKKTLTKYGYGEGEFPKEFWTSSFAEYENLLILVSSDGELMAVDGEKGKVAWRDNHIHTHGGAEQASYSVVLDNFNNYWVLSSDHTFIYSQKERRWFDSIYQFLAEYGISGLPENLQVWDMIMDQRNWVWLATDHEGLIIVDLENKEIKQLLNNKYDDTSLSENTVKRLMLDKSGNMWIGAYRNGLNQYIERPSGIRTIELGDINTTVEAKDGTYWLGTDNRGIIKYNPITETSELIDKSSGFASDVMVASYCSHDGALWFGTYNGGLIEIDPNGRIKNYLVTGADDGLLNNNVWSVTEDKWGDIWIGTLGNGVQRLNVKTGKFKTWSSYNTPLKENFMTSLAWIKKGWLMVGHSQFYSFINPVSGQVKNDTIPVIPGKPAAMASTACVIEDSRGLIWHGSTSGCCIVDKKTGQQTLLDMNSGLFGSSVVGIAEDLLHTMWVVTEHGISNVTPKKEENGEWTFIVRSFSSRDGLQQGPYNQRSISRTRDGLILVGGMGGVDVINPKQIAEANSTSETPIFSGLKLFGQEVSVGREFDGRVILDEALDVCRELTLRSDENQFTIQLATDKGEVHNTSRFVYMLEGFSDRWVKIEESDPNITYMSLHHGSYILHVRMLNDDGTMGATESTLKITITPPLLRNRWIILLFILFVLGVAWLWRRRFLQKHEEKVELEDIRREVEKKQWMNEMMTKLREKKHEEHPEPAPVQQEPTWGMTADALNKKPGDLQEFMKNQCAQYKAPKEKKVKFSFFPLAHDLMVDFDHDMLGQAVQILLNNAVMFSPKDCRIKVFVDKTSAGGSIRISDNGIGLPKGAKEHMFDPVVSDDDSGVCLSVVKDIVTAHGGTVVGDDNAGGGSVFTITIPFGEEIETAVLMDEEE